MTNGPANAIAKKQLEQWEALWPTLFGPQFGLERRLPLALQFVTFSADQRSVLKKPAALPKNIETIMDAFHARLSPEEQADPKFAELPSFRRPPIARAALLKPLN
jgi:hypothetical protein